jgi:hypothetical protein
MKITIPNQFHCLSVFVAVLSFESSFALAQDNTAELLKKVRATWNSRRDAIKTFHYECQLEETVRKASRPDATDILGQVAVGEETIDVVLRSDITFSFDKGKLAFSMKGQQWDESRAVPKDSTYRTAFNGVHKTLIQGPSMPQGLLDRRGKPGATLTTLVHEVAFWLWFDPGSYLGQTDFSVERAEIGQKRVFRDGHECLELVIPAGANANWTGLLYVDIQRSYVPVHFTKRYKGVAVCEIEIKYVADSEVEWAVDSWRRTQLNSVGRAQASYSGKVLKCAINSVLDDEVFTFTFPPGCHITEYTNHGPRYFVQQSDGSLKPISESEYGAIDNNKMTSLQPSYGGPVWHKFASGALVVVLGVSILVKYRNRGCGAYRSRRRSSSVTGAANRASKKP